MAEMNRDGVRVGVVGILCVGIGTIEDTNRDCWPDKANPIAGSAQVSSSLGFTATGRRRDGMME
jgi:hypothetical protein